MKALLAGSAYLAMASGLAFAQPPQPGPAFNAASVKPAAHSVRNFLGGPGTRNPEQISYTYASLQELLLRAYGLDDPKSISGPSWLDAQRYDITAKLPPGTTKEQFQKMLQDLLTDRLKLATHHESKDVPAYDLVLAEGGLKLKLGEVPETVKLPPSPEHGNYPILPGDDSVPAMAIAMGEGRGYLKARQEPPFVLAKMLSGPVGRPIVDKTGVTARYDFTLDFDLRLAAGQAPKEAAGSTDDPTPSVFDALEQQLGLKLVESKTKISILVVDRAEKVPSGE